MSELKGVIILKKIVKVAQAIPINLLLIIIAISLSAVVGKYRLIHSRHAPSPSDTATLQIKLTSVMHLVKSSCGISTLTNLPLN